VVLLLLPLSLAMDNGEFDHGGGGGGGGCWPDRHMSVILTLVSTR
jgi:hypothetical protein